MHMVKLKYKNIVATAINAGVSRKILMKK